MPSRAVSPPPSKLEGTLPPTPFTAGSIGNWSTTRYMTTEGKPEAHFVDFVQNSYMTAEGEPVDV